MKGYQPEGVLDVNNPPCGGSGVSMSNQSTGWICARCGRSWSPSVLECPCKPKEEELRK